jgi:hypothetical protein
MNFPPTARRLPQPLRTRQPVCLVSSKSHASANPDTRGLRGFRSSHLPGQSNPLSNEEQICQGLEAFLPLIARRDSNESGSFNESVDFCALSLAL